MAPRSWAPKASHLVVERPGRFATPGLEVVGSGWTTLETAGPGLSVGFLAFALATSPELWGRMHKEPRA